MDADDRVLDGRNRARACEELGLEPPVQVWDGEGSVAELVLSLNLHRRHLDESQRAMVAARLAKVLETEAVKRKGRRVDLVANLLPGSRCRSSAQVAGAVPKPEQAAAVAGGATAITRKFRELRGDSRPVPPPDKDDRRAAVDFRRSGDRSGGAGVRGPERSH